MQLKEVIYYKIDSITCAHKKGKIDAALIEPVRHPQRQGKTINLYFQHYQVV